MKKLTILVLAITAAVTATAIVNSASKAQPAPAGSGSASAAPAVTCGDGKIAGDEKCDDGNTDNDDGCDSNCAVEAGYACEGAPSSCSACSAAAPAVTCGDGKIAGDEDCDDGNTDDGDGCDSNCAVEPMSTAELTLEVRKLRTDLDEEVRVGKIRGGFIRKQGADINALKLWASSQDPGWRKKKPVPVATTSAPVASGAVALEQPTIVPRN